MLTVDDKLEILKMIDGRMADNPTVLQFSGKDRVAKERLDLHEGFFIEEEHRHRDLQQRVIHLERWAMYQGPRIQALVNWLHAISARLGWGW